MMAVVCLNAVEYVAVATDAVMVQYANELAAMAMMVMATAMMVMVSLPQVSHR